MKKFPSATLYVVGLNPPDELLSIAKGVPQMKVLGFVDDVEKYLLQCSVFLAPLRFGGGVKMKILHVMAHGIPVVTTKIGIEGIDGLQLESILVGDPAEKIADHVCCLLSNTSRAASMGIMCMNTITQHYSMDRMAQRLEDAYLRTFASSPANM